MSSISMASLANRLQELYINSPYSKEFSYGRALIKAIATEEPFMEVEVLKSLGDLRLQKGKLSKDSAEFDKAAALYAAAVLRCKDPDMRETLEHRIGYMEKLSRQLLQGYSSHFWRLSPDYWGSADSNVLRVTETCLKLERYVRNSWHSVEVAYTKTLVRAIENSDMFLEIEVLKSLGDFYLEKGKRNSEVSRFSKAASMYNKALAICGSPETKLTLEHRIRYTEKNKEAAIKKSRRREQRLQQLGNITRAADFMQDHHVSPHITREYTNHLKEGESSLARADLDSAEQHFAAALKMVHVRDPTAQQYHREVEPLCKLGDVYSKRGQHAGDGGDFAKAAALYNAAIARSEDQVIKGNIETTIREVEKSFLKFITGAHSNVNQYGNEKHKKQLKEMRDQIKLEMETIKQLDPYVHGEENPSVKEIEAKRSQVVRKLFEKIAQQRKEFIILLVEECIGLMGPPPCKYALIGLGSQATGLVTPYSDLEFAILVEEESEKGLVYFRNLTHYLHLKVVNLGETILPSLGIKSLNNFNSKYSLDSWYYDSVTPRGFAFDGSMPKASKTPLGRQGAKNEPPSELICTPVNMVSILQNDVTLYLKEGYHLATILRNPCLIAGDQDLIDTYMDITVEILQADGGKMAQQLAQETLRENNDIYKDLQSLTARLVDVKKELYRFPAVAVDCLALFSCIIPTTVWETIEEMENQQVISTNNAHHLTVLTSISAELRLRTYMANGGQKENLSALASIETELQGQESSLQTHNEVQTNTLKKIFYLPNEKQLFRYYYTALPLRYHLFTKYSEQKVVLNSSSDFYETSAVIKAMMYNELCKYSQATRYYQVALKEAVGNDAVKIFLLNRLGGALSRMGDNLSAVSYLNNALSLARSSGPSVTDQDIAMSLGHLGGAYRHMGEYRKAIPYLQEALQMSRNRYGQNTAHSDLAYLLNMLGSACDGLGDFRKAINYYEKSLQMYRSIYGQSKAHPDIASTLNNLGLARKELSDFVTAISYLEQALKMRRSMYGYSTAHPEIATSLRNLGMVWRTLGDSRKAISYYEQAILVDRSIYSSAHSDIANTLNNLGVAWSDLGDNRKAIRYHEQALQMSRSIHGQSSAHSHIANSLNNLGSAWEEIGDHRKAISYHEQALQKRKTIYGQSTPHPDTAMSLMNLGQCMVSLGDYRKSISYHEEALQMHRSIYGHGTDHREIAISLCSLGDVCYHLREYWKAISYHEQALQVRRSIYGQTKSHPDIAMSLNNLGMTWLAIGNIRKALSLFQEAFDMAKQLYPEDKSHPHIKKIENNLNSTTIHHEFSQK
ncbi:uncharacterized protein LOC144911109 [Branchiostoma floridae x Branchiostoma belcheri]